MGDFLKCPRLYYLHNMYKSPTSGNKMSIVSPHMSLGIAVHEVLEGLAEYPASERMGRDLRAKFEEAWLKVTGKKGGFTSADEEEGFKMRGKEMINNVAKSKSVYTNLDAKVLSVNVHGKTAVSRYLLTGTETKSDGKSTELKLNILQVWVKEKKAWKLLARQAVKVS